MDSAQMFIDGFLAHYSSQYYDPAKAHEYYLKNRELQGRNSTKGMSAKEKEAWAYAKDKIGEAKKEESKNISLDQKTDLHDLSTKASEKRKEISEKLSGLLKIISDRGKSESAKISGTNKKESEAISEDLKKKLEKASEDASRQIAALPPIPKGISKEQRAELAAKRSEEIAKIRGDATSTRNALKTKASNKKEILSEKTTTKRDALSKWQDADRAGKRELTAKDREAVGTDLKAAVEKTKAHYTDLKEKMVSKYNAALDTEFQAIKKNV